VKTYSTDTFVFRLHYKATMGLLLACCLLITAIQLVTDPITCDVKGVSGGIFNAFCWTHATFTLPYRHLMQEGSVLQPGVGPLKAGTEPRKDATYHSFYQVSAVQRQRQTHTLPSLPVGGDGAVRAGAHLLHPPLPLEDVGGEEGGAVGLRHHLADRFGGGEEEAHNAHRRVLLS
jgi:hypothetical protein